MSSGGAMQVRSSLRTGRRKYPFACVLLSILVTAPVIPARTQPSAEELLQRLQRRYETVNTLSAEFTQIFSSQGMRQEEAGVLLMKKPGKMYWEYRRPNRKLFVSDGDRAYFYVPADRQVMVTNLNSEDTGTPLLFLFGKGDLVRDFEVSDETDEDAQDPENRLLRLEPRRPRGDFSRILLEIDPVTLQITRLAVIEPIGSRNDYRLTGVQENIRVPDRRFRFKIPSGVEVIRQ